MPKNVLLCIIVDDEPLAQQVLENYINRTDELTLVATCESVDEAIDVLKVNQADLIFLDLDLKTVRGTEIVGQLKALQQGKYFIVITSAASPHRLNAAEVFTDDQVVLVDYLSKPFSLARFQDAVRKVLNHHENKSRGG